MLRGAREDLGAEKLTGEGDIAESARPHFVAFVEQHEFRCFKCGAEKAEWAKTGISKRGPWAICARCVGEDARNPPVEAADVPPSAQPDARPTSTMPTIYTDGACSGNPGRGGYAAVIVGLVPGKPTVVSGGEAETTNNRMEMRAVIEGLNALDPSPALEVVTDSEYVLKGYTEWLPNWVKRGWRTSAKKPVKNADLWQALTAAAQRHGQITWRWTRGHSGDHFNEMANAIAERIVASP